MEKNRAKQLIQSVLNQISATKQAGRNSEEFTRWRRDTRVAIAKIFGKDSQNVKDFGAIRFAPRMFVAGGSDDQFQTAFQSGMRKANAILDSMLNEIEEYWDNEPVELVRVSPSPATHFSNEDRVFVVHGRDEGTKDSVTRFLETLGLNPIVLQEQPDQGQTVIEKFEEYAEKSRFAVVLCTPDDFGGLDDGDGDSTKRARQNVIFELGFFVGSLGRSRVSLLVRGDVEIPSDFAGVLYTKLDDSGAWKMKIIQELKAAGFAIDANRAFVS